MFAMDWATALITMLLTGCLYLYIFYRKPGTLILLDATYFAIDVSFFFL